MGDALVGHNVEYVFGVGDDVIYLFEEDGYGCLWGSSYENRLFVGLNNLGFDRYIHFLEMGDDAECGDLCVPKIWVTEIVDVLIVDSL